MISATRGPTLLSEQNPLEHKLGEIAEKIRDQGRKRRLIAKVLRNVKNDLRLPLDERGLGIVESDLVYRVEDCVLDDIVVAGIDGGVLNKPLHGLDLILVRALAAIFSYEDGKLSDVDYHPSEMPTPDLVNVHEPLDSREIDILVGLKRQISEIDRARETAQKKDVDVIMLDGSVVPQYTNNVRGEMTRELYKKLIYSYRDLYQLCEKKEILLLGAVKDSRSARLAKLFQKKIFPKLVEEMDLSVDELDSIDRNSDILLISRDTDFLDYLLDAKERSFTFKYSESSAPLLNDLGEWKESIYAFYVKPVPYDCPVRVEFVSDQKSVLESAEKSAALVSTLSANHDACALPSVLIEADARAALAEEEISILRDSIVDRLEPSTLVELRRERRPF